MKHFATIDGPRKRTFGARGAIQSRDLERAKECGRVYLGDFVPRQDWIRKKAVVNHHRELPCQLLFCDKSKPVGDPDAPSENKNVHVWAIWSVCLLAGVRFLSFPPFLVDRLYYRLFAGELMF